MTYFGRKPLSTSTPRSDFGRSRTWPTEALTSNSEPSIPEIVRALAGDSTTTSPFAFLFVTLSSVTGLRLPGPNVRHRPQLADQALQLQHRQHAAYCRDREAALPAHLIDVHRLSRYMTQQGGLRIRRWHAFFHLDLLRHHRQVQLFQHVPYTCNELGALLDQFIRPVALV